MTESNTAARLDQLAYKLEQAKAREIDAREARIAIEHELSTVAGVKAEGRMTTTGEYYKVVTNAGFTRALDQAAWRDVKARLPAEIVARVTKTKEELNLREFKALRESDPEHFSILAEAVVTKPQKLGVNVQRIEGEQ